MKRLNTGGLSARLAGIVAIVLMLGMSRGVQAQNAPSTQPSVGDMAKDFSLMTPTGQKVSLFELTKEKPVVLVVLRGWPGYQCPICSRQVGDFIAAAKEFSDRNANVVMVYPGPAENLKAYAEEFAQGKLFPDHFKFVIDPEYAFVNAYNLRWNAPRETAYPSTFVIDKTNHVKFAKISTSHAGRSTVQELTKALDELKMPMPAMNPH